MKGEHVFKNAVAYIVAKWERPYAIVAAKRDLAYVFFSQDLLLMFINVLYTVILTLSVAEL